MKQNQLKRNYEKLFRIPSGLCNHSSFCPTQHSEINSNYKSNQTGMTKMYATMRAGKTALVFLMAVAFSILSLQKANAQVTVSGANSGNGSYTTLSTAFTNIGTSQSGANIIIDITADVTQNSTATLGAGTWASVLIRPSGGATRTISGAVTAGSPMIDLSGADNVTIDGLNSGGNALVISNTTANTTSGTSTIRLVGDATNNLITNCTIKSAFNNTTASTNGGAIWFSTGTTTGNDNNTVSNCDITAVTAGALTKCIHSAGSTTSATIENSGNTITNNNIYDYFVAGGGSAGIYLSTGTQGWTITNNRIYQTGTRTQTTASTHNAIFISNSANTAGGFTITGNTIGYASNSRTGTMTYAGTVNSSFNAINFTQSATGANSTISQNHISNISFTHPSGATSTIFYGIWNQTSSTSQTQQLTINQDTVQNINLGTITTSTGYGINAGSSASLTLTNNYVYNVTRGASGAWYSIYTVGTCPAGSVTGNTIDSVYMSSTSFASTLGGLYVSTAIANVSNNTITRLRTNGTSGTVYGLYLGGTVSRVAKNNNIYNCTFTGTGTTYSIYKIASGTVDSVSNNNIYNMTTTGAGTFYGIYIGSSTTMTYVTGNNIYNNTLASATIDGIRSTTGNTDIASNNIYGFAGTNSGPLYTGIQVSGGTTQNVYNNNVYNLSATGTGSPLIDGIKIGGATTQNCYQNTVYGISNTSGATAPFTVGIEYVGAGGTYNIYRNKVYDISCNGTVATSYGIGTGSSFTGTTANIYNNVIGDIKAPQATGLNAVIGINIRAASATQTHRVYFNSVYLNATSSSLTTFGTSCVAFPSGITLSSGLGLDLRNNILINNSTPAQDAFNDANNGIAACLRMTGTGTGGSVPSFYATTSNRNNFWCNPAAGTANHVVYCEGLDATATNSYNSISGYKGFTVDRDQLSFADNLGSNTSPTSMDLTTTSGTYLKIAASTLTQCESGATVITTPSITDDYSGATGNRATTPDVGAYEFSGTTPAPTVTLNSVTPSLSPACTATARLISVDITTPSGSITSATITYTYNGGGGASNVAMTNTTGNTWEYTIPAASSPANATVAWSITTTNSISLTTVYTGTSYYDEPLTGVTAAATTSATSICSGTSINLTAVLSKVSSDTLGAGGTTSTSSGGTFLPGGWGGNKTQYIVRASELQALGFTAGNFTALGFRPTAAGDTYEGFALSIGQTSQTTMTNTTMISSGLTQVYKGTSGGNEGLLPVANTTNTLTFGTGSGSASSFAWDGTSNLVLSFCWSSVPAAGTSTVSGMLGDNPGFACTGSGQSDNLTPAAMCALTTGFGTSTSGTFRPKFIFTGNKGPAISSVNWVSTLAGNTVGTGNPLTFAPVNSPAGSPDSTTRYIGVITSLGCVISNDTTASVTIKSLPSLPNVDTTVNLGAQCGTPTYYARSTASSPTYKFYTVASGGSPIETNSTGNYTYNGATFDATNTLYISVTDGLTGCESDRVQCDVYVNAPATFSIYHSGSVNTCVNRIDTLNVTSTLGNYETYTWSPTTNLYTDAAATTPYTGGNATTVYYKNGSVTTGEKITASAVNTTTSCSATDTVRFVVNANPLVTSATATPSAACSGSTVTLNGQSIPASAGTATIGASATTTSTYNAPFYSLWSNKHMQILIKQAELTSAGLTTGNLTAISFPTTSGTVANLDYTLKLKSTTGVSSMSAFETSGFTTVYTASSVAQTAGTDNTITFTTPFYWDGTSDIIIEMCWGNSASTATLSSTSPADNTAYVSVIKTHATAATAGATICTDNTTNSLTYSVRPVIKFAGQIGTNQTGSYTWTWHTAGINGATIASGSSTTNVPTNVNTYPNTTSLTYTAKATNASTGCYGSLGASTVAVYALPPAPTNASTTPQCGAPTYTASTTVTGSPTFKWYSASTGGTLLQSSTATTYVQGTGYTAGGATNSVWVSVTDANGCEGARTQCDVVVNTPPTLSISPAGITNTCVNAITEMRVTSTLEDFDSYVWTPSTNLYTDAAATSGYAGSNDDTVYFKRGTTGTTIVYTLTATNSISGCSAIVRDTFNVNANPTVLVATATPSAVCNGSSVSLNGSVQAATGTYTAPPAVTNATTDEDLGSVVITATIGGATVLSNTTAVNSFDGTIGTATGTLGSYSNFTAFGPYTLTKGTSYDFSLTSVQQGGGFSNSMAIYIDYNRDGDFADAGENVYVAGATTAGDHTETGSFTVPTGATTGPCRMRIICNEGTISSSTQAVTYGEYEEYAIYISDGVTYNWSWSNGYNTVATSSIATVASSNSGIMDSSVVYTATATNASTGCYGSLAATAITVHPSPAAPTDNSTDTTQCGTPTYLATGAAYNGSYRWYTVASGGTAISGATGASYLYTGYSLANSPAATPNTLYVSIVDSFGCEGARTAITVNVSVPPTLTISPSGADSSCVDRVRTINVTSTVGDFDTYIWSPNTNLYTNSDGTGAYAGTSRDTVYYKRSTTTSSAETFTLTATHTGTGCVNTASVNFVVRANPVVTSATASPGTLCNGASVSLAALSIPAVADTTTINNGTATTISSTTGLPYRLSAGLVTAKAQYLIRASEMIAKGYTTGNLTSLGFKLTATSGAVNNMTINIAHTTDTALTTTFATPTFTQVFSDAATYTPVVGYNVHTFSTPFYWNGTSNIIVEVCNTVTTSGSQTATASTPGFVACSQSTSGCAATTTTTSTNRPVIVFGGQIGTNQTSSLTWSWTSSNHSGTVATGATTSAAAYNTNTNNTAANETFTATATNSSTCTASLAATAISVNASPNTPTNTSVATQCGTPTFSVSSNSGLASPTYRWYTVATGGTAISGATTDTYVLPSYVVGVNTLYVSEVNAGTGCEGARVQCDVTASNPPVLDVTANQTSCVQTGNAIMLTATTGIDSFTTFTWSPTTNLYTDAALTVAYAGGNEDTVYVNGGVVTASTTYSLIASGGGCTNNDSTIVVVNSVPNITTDPVTNGLCGTGNTTLGVIATGTNLTYQWQMSANGTSGWTNVADSTPTQTGGSAYYTGTTSSTLSINRLGTSYYYRVIVSNTGCTNDTSTAALVVAGTPAIASTTPGTRCGQGTAVLGATANVGETVSWYAAATGGTALGTGTSFTTPTIAATTTYYAQAQSTATSPGYMGRLTPVSPSATTLTTYGEVFTLTTAATIYSVDVISGTGTSITVSLYNSDGTTQLQTTGAVAVTAGATQAINLGWTLSAGTYRLIANGMTGTFMRENSSVTWPITLGTIGTVDGFVSSITGTVTTSASYYWFYNWSMTSVCISPTRTAVVATVTTPPSVTIDPATATICAGSPATLTASSSNDPNYQYTWTASSVTVGTGAVLNVTPSATTTYVVTAVDTTGGANAGCNITTSRSVTVNPKPTSINPSNNAGGTICKGTAVNLSVTASAGSGATISGYSWTSTPAGYTSSTQNPTGVTPDVSTGYQVKVTNSFSCADSNTTSVTVYPAVTAAVSGSTAVCAGDSATVTVAFTGSAPWSYTYNDGTNHTVSVSSSPYIFKVAPASTQTVTSVSVTDNNNCSAVGADMTGSAVITVNAAPTATITGASVYCPTPGAALSASSSTAGSGTITGYQWKLNGSDISGETNSTYTAFGAGNYTVVVTNSNGCYTTSAAHAVSLATYTITATSGSNGSISPSGAVVKDCETSQLFTFTPASCYQVDSVFVDGSYVGSSSTYNVTNITASGTIHVVYRLIPYAITKTAHGSGSITGAASVNCGTNSTYTFAPTNGCSQIDSVVVDGISVGAVTSYELVNVTGTHTIDAYFSTLTYSVVASAGSNGSISPSGTSNVNCGDTLTYTITANGGYGILDVLVDGSSVGAVSSYSFNTITANHTISASFYDTLCPNPPTASAGANATICEGTNYTLGGTIGGGATSATWSSSGTGTFNNSGVFGSATTYTPSGADITAGSVVITLTTDNPGGSCTPAVSNLTLTIKPLATASISGTTTICSGTGTTITFTGTANAVVTYTINGGSNQTITLNGGGSANLNTGNLTANTTYALVSVATGGTPDCSQSASGSAVVTVNALPTASSSAASASVCTGTGTTINFTGTPNATVTYNIDGGSNTTITLDGSGAGSVNTGNLTADVTYNLVSIQDNGTPNCSNTLSSSTTVTVIASPTAGISGTTTICTGTSTNISFTGTANATITYTINGGANQTVALNGTGNASVSTGNLTADATYALVSVATAGTPSCTASASGSAVVTVSTPSVSITSACGSTINLLTGNTYSFSANVGAGSGTISTYQWQRDAGNVGANSPNLNNQSTAGSYTLTITNSLGCSATSAAVTMSGVALNGTYTIGSSGCNNFSSFANAFSHLNSYGVTGSGATFNIAGGYTETAPAGGLVLGSVTLDSSAFKSTASSPIVFQKISGVNPLITASIGHTAGNILDGVIKLHGVDYVTFDGINVTENASNTITTLGTNTMTEFGYALLYRDSTDGAQNNTIKNSTITMSRTYPNSFGIYSNTRHKSTNGTTVSARDAATAGGSNSRNTVYNDTITNVNYPIAFIGANVSNNMDTLNDIGTTVGNVITNWGSSTAATASYTSMTSTMAAIYMNHQKGYNVSYNNISTTTPIAIATHRGIYADYTATSPEATNTFTNTISNNTIALKSSNTSGTFQHIGVANTATSIAATGTTLNLTNNNLIGTALSGASSSSAIVGITNAYPAGTLNMNNNVFRSHTSTATTGGMTAFANTGAVVNTININNNQIGNATGGAITYSVATSGATAGISNTGGAATARAYILGNDFRGFTHSTNGTSSHTYIANSATVLSDSICGNTFTRIVAATSGSVTFMTHSHTLPATGMQTVSNNMIVDSFYKSVAGGTITLSTSSASSTAGAVITHSNNNFSNIRVLAATTIAGWVSSDGGTANKTYSNNTFTNWIGGSSAVTGMSITLGGGAGGYGNQITNNIVRNLTTSGAITGISTGSGTVVRSYSNTVDSLFSTGTGGTVIGMTTGGTTSNIYSNTISRLSTTSTTGAVTGLIINGATSDSVYKNKIYDLAGTATTTGTITGMSITAGTTVNAYNNIIGDLRATTATGAAAINGIQVSGGTTVNLYYNSVYLNATGGTTFGSSAIYVSSTTPTVTLRNNNFVNLSTPGSTSGSSIGLRYVSAPGSKYGSASNNNNFYAGTPGTYRLIYGEGTAASVTNPQQTLAAFKAYTGKDGASTTENPTYVSTTGSNANFLNIDGTVASTLESGAGSISGITDDYNGNTRNVSTPDIGAWEFTGTLNDIIAPAIGTPSIAAPCNGSTYTVTSTITDATGVYTVGSLVPRIYYYKKHPSVSAWYSTAGTLSSGTAQNGSWSFTINAADFGGTAVGDSIGYFIIAQDSTGSNNLSANPSTGLVATDVNTVTTNPTSPLLFRIQNTLSGSYTVGAPTSNYTTLAAAITEYNNACLGGPVTFLLDSTNITYSTTAIAANSQASATNTLTIKPNTGLNVTVYGAPTSGGIFNLNGADYVTIDGSNNGTTSKNLTISNTSTTGTYAGVLIASLGSGAGATNNTVKNCNIQGGLSTLATSYGISVGGSTAGSTGADNDKNTIQNNTIIRSYYGIYGSGSATTNPGAMDSLAITGNTVGGTAGTQSTYVTTYGVTVGNGLGGSISQNTIQNIVNTLTTSPAGIQVLAGYTNASITRNRIDSVYTSNTGGYGGRGIVVGTADAASNLTIANNMISQVSGASNWSTFGNSSSMGIALGVTTTTLTTVTGGVNLWNNTVDMRGNFTSTTTSVVTAALYVGSAVTNADIRNNIFSNNLINIGAGTTPKAYAINSAAANTAFSNINNNNYYVGDGTQGVLGNIAATDYSSLATLTTAFGGNAASVNVKPNFTSASDVHLVTTTNCALNGTAASIGAVTVDYDGDTRSGTPDIGADEFTSTFNLVTNPVVVCGGTGNLTAAAVTTGSVVGAGTTYSYWTDAAATASYATPAAATAGTYYIRATSGTCTNTPATAVTVTVNTASTAPTSASASDTIVCPSGATTLTQIGGSLGTSAQWMWYSDAGLTTKVDSSSASNGQVTVNPAATTTYYVRAEGTASPCAATTSSVSKLVSAITVNGSYSHNWKGGTSTDWSVAANWCPGTVPTASNDAYISSDALILNQPALSVDAAVKHILVGTGATVTVGSGLSLSANGDVNRTGNITGAGTLVLNGTTTQTLSGAGSLTDNITVNNTGANVVMNSAATVAGALTLTAGNLDVNGQSLTLAGSVSGASSILATSTGSTVVLSGPATVPTQLGSTVANLTISRTAGVAMSGDLTITEALTQTNGKFAIGAGNTLTLSGTLTGSASNSITGSSTSKLTATSCNGIVYFDQTTSGDVAVTNGTNTLQNLVVGGTSAIQIGNKLNILNRLAVTTGASLDLAGNTVLRSTASGTAYVDVVTGTITGQTIVERYLHKQARGWRAITAPVTYDGIISGDNNKVKNNWQNDWGYGTGYGTIVTGPVANVTNGLDYATTGSSLQTYNSTTGAWNKITNTNTETMSGSSATAANKGFYMFVRGDRTITPATTTPFNFTPTILASKGLLQTGTQVFNFTGTANKTWLIGNPYASAINMESVAANNIGQYIYIWDPNLTGYTTATTGNYATFDRSAWSAGPNSGNNTKYFQSGMAFFVVPSSTSASITFTEADKASSTWNNTQSTGSANGLADIFNVKLLNVKTDGSRSEVDGIRAKFGANYAAGVDADDATKWPSAGIENMSLSRNGKSLVIEARPYITTTDSLFLNMSTVSSGANYEFTVNPINFDASVSSCKLVDKFLNTETAISLTSITTVGFNVTSVAGSSAADRFYFVFNGAGSLATNSLNVKAYKKNNSVVVDWEAIAENNMKMYDVEKSIDGSNFSHLANEAAKNGNATNKYSFTDNNPVIGVNYYRIKSTQATNGIKYSAIVRVEMNEKGIKSITVYPNPVKGSVIGLQMNNLEAGDYTARLFNNAGQEIWNKGIKHNGSNGSISIQLKNALASGNYQLQLTNDAKGTKYQQTILVVE